MSEEIRDSRRYVQNAPPLALYVAGEDMPTGTPVSQSRRAKNIILMADANDPDRMPCIGALYQGVKAQEEALVLPAGMATDLRKTETFNPGSYIYISATRGYFTKHAPTLGTTQIVGVARNDTSGLLFAIPPNVVLPGAGHAVLGNHTITAGDGTNEIKFAYAGAPDGSEFTVFHHGMLWVELDMSNLVADAEITVVGRLYHLIDGVTLKQIDRKEWHAAVGAVDENHMTLSGAVTSGKTIQVSLQCSKIVGGNRVVKHVFIQDT